MSDSPDPQDAPSAETFRVRHGFDLAEFDPTATPDYDGKKSDGEELLALRGERLSELQTLLYANGRSPVTADAAPAVLVVLQGMDAAGKGGIVDHVLGLVDPKAVRYHAFGVPTEEERAHHYLWRIRRALPGRGLIGVFDRSHYEDVIAVGVNRLAPEEVWRARYDEINAFEAELTAAGTHVVKIALMLGPDEQKERFAARLEDPAKHWKYNPHDLDDRARWSEFRAAYQEVFDRTSTEDAPWYVVPADHKWFARLAVTEILVERLERLGLEWPPADFDVEAEHARVAAL